MWQSDSSPSDVNLEFMLVGADSEFGFSVLLPPEGMNLECMLACPQILHL